MVLNRVDAESAVHKCHGLLQNCNMAETCWVKDCDQIIMDVWKDDPSTVKCKAGHLSWCCPSCGNINVIPPGQQMLWAAQRRTCECGEQTDWDSDSNTSFDWNDK